jgi:hypothetical protein
MILGAVQARLAATPSQMGKGGGKKAKGAAAAPKAKGAKKPAGPQAAWQAFRESVKDKPLSEIFDPEFPERKGKDGKAVNPFELYRAAREAQGQRVGSVNDELARLASRKQAQDAAAQAVEGASEGGAGPELGPLGDWGLEERRAPPGLESTQLGAAQVNPRRQSKKGQAAADA